MLDYFAKEKGKTKQDTTIAHLGKIKDIDADKVISEFVNGTLEYDFADGGCGGAGGSCGGGGENGCGGCCSGCC